MLSDPLSKELLANDAVEKIAHLAAKINHLNSKQSDGFIRELHGHRLDLRGLPLLIGKECRTSKRDTEVSAGRSARQVSIGW